MDLSNLTDDDITNFTANLTRPGRSNSGRRPTRSDNSAAPARPAAPGHRSTMNTVDPANRAFPLSRGSVTDSAPVRFTPPDDDVRRGRRQSAGAYDDGADRDSPEVRMWMVHFEVKAIDHDTETFQCDLKFTQEWMLTKHEMIRYLMEKQRYRWVPDWQPPAWKVCNQITTEHTEVETNLSAAIISVEEWETGVDDVTTRTRPRDTRPRTDSPRTRTRTRTEADGGGGGGGGAGVRVAVARLDTNIRGTFHSSFHLQDFPFDSQLLSVELESAAVGPGKAYWLRDMHTSLAGAFSLRSLEWTTAPTADTGGTGTGTGTGTGSGSLNGCLALRILDENGAPVERQDVGFDAGLPAHPYDSAGPEAFQICAGMGRFKVQLDAAVDRQSSGLQSRIVMPMALFTLLALSAFTLEGTADRVTVSVTFMLTATTYSITLADLLPALGYLTWIDNYILVSFAFIASVTVATILLDWHHATRAFNDCGPAAPMHAPPSVHASPVHDSSMHGPMHWLISHPDHRDRDPPRPPACSPPRLCPPHRRRRRSCRRMAHPCMTHPCMTHPAADAMYFGVVMWVLIQRSAYTTTMPMEATLKAAAAAAAATATAAAAAEAGDAADDGDSAVDPAGPPASSSPTQVPSGRGVVRSPSGSGMSKIWALRARAAEGLRQRGQGQQRGNAHGIPIQPMSPTATAGGGGGGGGGGRQRRSKTGMYVAVFVGLVLAGINWLQSSGHLAFLDPLDPPPAATAAGAAKEAEVVAAAP